MDESIAEDVTRFCKGARVGRYTNNEDVRFCRSPMIRWETQPCSKHCSEQYVSKESSHSETRSHSKTVESPPTEATGSQLYKNRLASGISPFAPLLSGSGDQDTSDLMFGDAAYGSRENVAACKQAGMTSGILHRNDVTARGKGSGDAWGVSVRERLRESPDAKRLDPMSQEERKKNQTYWKARLGYNMRWVVEGVFSLFKRLFGEHVTALKWENINQEILLKVALYNKWRDESISGSRCIVDDVICIVLPSKFGWRTGRVRKQGSKCHGFNARTYARLGQIGKTEWFEDRYLTCASVSSSVTC